MATNFLDSFFKFHDINNEQDENKNDILQVKIYNLFLALSFFIIPFCIHKTNEKMKKIKDPDLNNSYCVISIAILINLKYSLWYLMLLNILMVALIVRDEVIDNIDR